MRKSRFLIRNMKDRAQQNDIFKLSKEKNREGRNTLLTKNPCLVNFSLRMKVKLE